MRRVGVADTRVGSSSSSTYGFQYPRDRYGGRIQSDCRCCFTRLLLRCTLRTRAWRHHRPDCLPSSSEPAPDASGANVETGSRFLALATPEYICHFVTTLLSDAGTLCPSRSRCRCNSRYLAGEQVLRAGGRASQPALRVAGSRPRGHRRGRRLELPRDQFHRHQHGSARRLLSRSRSHRRKRALQPPGHPGPVRVLEPGARVDVGHRPHGRSVLPHQRPRSVHRVRSSVRPTSLAARTVLRL